MSARPLRGSLKRFRGRVSNALDLIEQVFVLRALVEAAENSDQPFAWWRGLILVVSMLVTSTLQSIGQHYTCNTGLRTGIKIKAAMSMAVFNKV